MEWQPVDDAPPRRRSAEPPDSDAARHVPHFAPGDALGIISGMVLLSFFALQLYTVYLLVTGSIDLDGLSLRAVDLWLNSAILLIAFGAMPFAWVATTRRGGWPGTLQYFQLKRPVVDLAIGFGLAVALVGIVLVVGALLTVMGAAPENPAIDDFQAIITWPLIIAVSLSAALGEEVLFRGIIQKHIGWIGQAFVFGMLHAYQGVFGIILTTLLGLLFGYIVKKRWGLWIPIVAHFFFDFIQLSILMLAPEL